MKSNTKRNWELTGHVMGLLVRAGFRPALDLQECQECPDSPTLKLTGVRYTKEVRVHLSFLLHDAGFTRTRYHIRAGGSPEVYFYANAQGEEVGIEHDISGDAPERFRISIGS